MKKEYPLVFKQMCLEIYNNIHVDNISIPKWNVEDLIITDKNGNDSFTPKNEIDGWVFENGICLDINCLLATETEIEYYNIKQEHESTKQMAK